eukprot:1159810-Pelagomonas_calceolata.AAC.5
MANASEIAQFWRVLSNLVTTNERGEGRRVDLIGCRLEEAPVEGAALLRYLQDMSCMSSRFYGACKGCGSTGNCSLQRTLQMCAFVWACKHPFQCATLQALTELTTVPFATSDDAKSGYQLSTHFEHHSTQRLALRLSPVKALSLYFDK